MTHLFNPIQFFNHVSKPRDVSHSLHRSRVSDLPAGMSRGSCFGCLLYRSLSSALRPLRQHPRDVHESRQSRRDRYDSALHTCAHDSNSASTASGRLRSSAALPRTLSAATAKQCVAQSTQQQQQQQEQQLETSTDPAAAASKPLLFVQTRQRRGRQEAATRSQRTHWQTEAAPTAATCEPQHHQFRDAGAAGRERLQSLGERSRRRLRSQCQHRTAGAHRQGVQEPER